MTVARGGPLNDPLGLAIAPSGDIITANGADGNSSRRRPAGTHPAVRNVIPNGGGDLFGVAVAPNQKSLYHVNDAGSGASATRSACCTDRAGGRRGTSPVAAPPSSGPADEFSPRRRSSGLSRKFGSSVASGSAWLTDGGDLRRTGGPA